jgi:hypothetical protein
VQTGEEADERAGQHPANDFVYRQLIATLSVPAVFNLPDFAVAD